MLEIPKAKVSFRYMFSNRFSGDVKWRVRIFIDDLHVGCIWCTEIQEDKQHIGIMFYAPDGLLAAEFYFLDYELVEDN